MSLMKKNRRGSYQARFFVTIGPYLKYWTNREDYINKEKENALATIDMREFDVSTNEKKKVVKFDHPIMDKVSVSLKAKEPADFALLERIVNEKRRFYDTNAFIKGEQEPSDYITGTFRDLLKLSTLDQNNWLDTQVADAFDQAMPSAPADGVSQAYWAVELSLLAMERFQLMCADAHKEVTSRRPAVMACVRDIMHRYIKRLAARAATELRPYLGAGSEPRVDALDETVLCNATTFLDFLDFLGKVTVCLTVLAGAPCDDFLSPSCSIALYLVFFLSSTFTWTFTLTLSPHPVTPPTTQSPTHFCPSRRFNGCAPSYAQRATSSLSCCAERPPVPTFSSRQLQWRIHWKGRVSCSSIRWNWCWSR